MRFILNYFELKDLSELRTEVVAGITSFVTMSYILAVNPGILSAAIFKTEPGDLFGPLLFATAISAMLATLFMGVVARYPFALAPGMGLNVYFTHIVLDQQVPWEVTLAVVMLEGVLFVVLSVTQVRGAIARMIPNAIKHATAAGIGLFIAYIALSGDPSLGGAGIIVKGAPTKLGNLATAQAGLTVAGILMTVALMSFQVRGALLWGIIATAFCGWLTGTASWPDQWVGLPAMPGDLAGKAFTGLGRIPDIGWSSFLTILFVFLFVDLFDTIGALTGLGVRSGYIGTDGNLPRINLAFLADSLGTIAGAILGTSTVTTYIESAAGIESGGKSGLTAVVTAILFGFAVFLAPTLQSVPGFATAPALVLVGILMISSVMQIRWNDITEATPAFLTLLIIPLSFSIADGLGAGLVCYPLLKLLTGKVRDTHLLQWILCAAFIAKFLAADVS